MPTLQELDSRQISLAVRDAAQRYVPLALCAHREGQWINLHSRFVALKDEHILIEMPVGEDGVCRYEFAPAEKIGLSFKLKHHKHISTATVARLDQFWLEDGTKVPVVSVCWPTRMHRLQRRAYLRVEVPENRIVRISFWLGGREAEPMGGSPGAPVWSGMATNISAGGLQLRSMPEASKVLEVGDVVGMRLLFGLGSEAVYTDAQFRHVETAGEGVLMGFQFLGLGQSRQGRRTLKVISAKVGEFHRAVGQHAGRR
ncbi:MAG: flagellar brake protein [Planctomycetota bacterium]|jgi:c-di-GMP-binding flagellar brake protein YcgR